MILPQGFNVKRPKNIETTNPFQLFIYICDSSDDYDGHFDSISCASFNMDPEKNGLIYVTMISFVEQANGSASEPCWNDVFHSAGDNPTVNFDSVEFFQSFVAGHINRSCRQRRPLEFYIRKGELRAGRVRVFKTKGKNKVRKLVIIM